MEWINPPPQWSASGASLTVHTAPQTDFWRSTYYGFVRDSGHLYYETVPGDFVAEVTVRGEYRERYDQAGLMVRLDEANWCKCGIEYFDGRQHASVVVTREFSDWSVLPFDPAPAAFHLRVIRKGDSLQIEYSLERQTFHLLRLAYFPPGATVGVGPMCCSPEGNGFDITFERLLILRS